MLRVVGRASLVFGVALLALAGTSVVGRTGSAVPNPAFAQSSTAGVSAAVAARTLNAMSDANARHAGKALRDVHFILNWVPNVEFAGLWMAEKQGLWAKAGLKLSYTPWSQSVFPEKDVPARGGDTFGFQSGAAIAIAVSKGEPITALYTDTQKSIFGLTVMNKSHITSLKQLKGKRVGYQGDEQYVPETMLAYVGLKPSDWTAVPVGFNIDQLTAGRVDAYLVFITNEPIDLRMRGIPASTFPAYKYGFHSYDDVMFTYNGLIQKDPTLVRTVTGIVARAYAYAHTHVNETVRYVTATTFKSPAAKQAQNIRQQMLEWQGFKEFSANAAGRYTGLMTTAQWRDNINTLFKYGLIKSKPNAATIYTNRFNPNK